MSQTAGAGRGWLLVWICLGVLIEGGCGGPQTWLEAGPRVPLPPLRGLPASTVVGPPRRDRLPSVLEPSRSQRFVLDTGKAYYFVL